MKKRTIKSLELNKKTISSIEATEVQGGFYLPYINTYAIGLIVIDSVEAATEYFD